MVRPASVEKAIERLEDLITHYDDLPFERFEDEYYKESDELPVRIMQAVKAIGPNSAYESELKPRNLTSANEEAQSANEELQSVNEELDTSKEELQSSNEELATVNDELQNRNVEVGRVNGDLNNLIESVNTSILMVDRELHIRSFSPEAQKTLGIIAADTGRPIGNMRMNLKIENLEALLQDAITKISSKEVEVQGMDGQWFSLRIKPYVTLDNKIDGAVMLLLDVTRIKVAELEHADQAQLFREQLETSVADRTSELDLAIRESEGFNYTVAHDLRNPLRAITFNNKMLLKDLLKKLSPEHAEMLQEQASSALTLA